MNKTMLTGFLIGTVLVLTGWLIFFKGPEESKPETPMHPQVITVAVGEKAELEGDTTDMVSDLHDDTGDESQPDIPVRVSDESVAPPKTDDAERVVGDESGVDTQAQTQTTDALADDPAQGPEHLEKAVFWQGFSSRVKAEKFARYISVTLNVPCEAEKTEKGYQIFFRYADPDDQRNKMAVLERAGFLK